MNKIIRYWNQNRKGFLTIFAVIVFVLIIINSANNLLKGSNSSNQTIQNNNTAVDLTKPNESITTGQKIPEEVVEKNKNIIQEFVEYCNQGKTQDAYLLLSKDCMSEFNNDINLFITNYYQKVFNINRSYKLELWNNKSNYYIYKITYINGNILASGGNNNAQNNIEDYITIIYENGENKININSFIKKQEIQKSQVAENIEILVNYKKVYKNYEIYNITIKNNTQNTINISENRENSDVCLVDSNDVEYNSFIEEFATNSLKLEKYRQTTINLRFNKMYDLDRNIQIMNFKNIIVNQDKADVNQNEVDKKVLQIAIGI